MNDKKTKTIEERADDYSTLFIHEYTHLPTDGPTHRALMKLFEEFAETIIKDFLKG